MPCRKCADGSWVCDAKTQNPCNGNLAWTTVGTQEQPFPAGVSNVWFKKGSREAMITWNDPDPDSHPDWRHFGWIAFEVAGDYTIEVLSKDGEFRVRINPPTS